MERRVAEAIEMIDHYYIIGDYRAVQRAVAHLLEVLSPVRQKRVLDNLSMLEKFAEVSRTYQLPPMREEDVETVVRAVQHEYGVHMWHPGHLWNRMEHEELDPTDDLSSEEFTFG